MTMAQERMARFYDERHGDTPAFAVNDKVFLEATNIQTDRPLRKLSPKRLGPFRITEVISTHAYRLELPTTMKIHNVFHVSLLTRHKPNTIAGRDFPEPPPDIVEGEEHYEVDKILNSRYIGNELQYLVRWVGYDQGEDSWEPAEFLEDAPEKVTEFHARFPLAFSPTRRPPPRQKKRRNARR